MQERPGSASALWRALVVVSFIVNILVVVALVLIFASTRRVAANLADRLDDFSHQTINYSLHITQTVPVHTDVPFSQTLVVPFNLDVPVSTTVVVSKEIPVVGVVAFDVPIQASVPVSLSVPIEVSRTIRVDAEVPLSLDVPLQVPLQDTSLKSALDDVIGVLNQVAGR
jgi:hypothetical protein